MTIFASLSFETTIRIWDCYINEGPKILFRVGLAMLEIMSKRYKFDGDAEFHENMTIFSKSV